MHKKYLPLTLLLLSGNMLYAQNSKKILKRDTTSIKNDTTQIKKQQLNEVVVSASRISESILRSPVSIEKITAADFRRSAAPSFFDALENVKGVQLITPSLGFRIINTRGFANTTNVRFTQLVDGVDNQAPHIGAPIGNALGPSDLDIESVEIIPGTASALYGLNAINGLANFITKDPFTTQGVSIQQKTGVNHVGDKETSAHLFSETSFRIAKALSKKFAFKLNGTYTTGYDWIADNTADLNAAANAKLGIGGGPDNPGYDPVNGYGNESSDRKTVTLGGKQYSIARTGYAEKDVTSYNLHNVKVDVGLAYKLNDNTRINYTYRFADLDNIYQRANRFRLSGYILQQHALEIKNNIYQVRGYWTSENTGKSYNLRSAGENIDRNFKNDNTWYADFTKGFNSATASGATVPQALQQARQLADAGRYQPGTAAFKNTLDKLADINNWDVGAALQVKDDLFHVEGQVNISNAISSTFQKETGLDLLAGFDHRTYIIHPDGNYFINYVPGKEYSNIDYSKTGGFVQVAKEFFDRELKLSATLRADRNDYFDLKLNPRFTAVYSPVVEQNFRVSFQSGYRFPSIFEAFSNVNSGGVKRIGGLRVVSNGIFENSYLRTSIDAFQAAVKNDFNSGINTNAAIEKEKGLLKKNQYTYLQPEHINSFEAGYKSILFDGQLSVDADFYYNKYNNFIGQVEINVPNTQKTDSIPYYLNDKNKQARYRAWTNSQSTVYNIGGSLGLSYKLFQNYVLTGNVSYAKLQRTANEDALEDGFNTPQWITNFSFGGNRVIGNFGFNASYKWQSGFYWQSFLVNGNVDHYGTIDAQVNYDFLKTGLNLKIGATNLTNKYYNSFLGGPAIGGFYYTTLTLAVK
ncbi:iron complex outermembrane recepter protein [Mucilaginibacter lappiensis]|uniref:Iron complex outermembrane receptor protein n=1 Tax=Mucilaginibacter lappiensis TaxID=354630 RepID=A0ABR6PPB8_9SPHI|nr:TonB-dependent receptor [Mucilaginibacter lappiensis]MBB6111594.1 iron complex outermembrane receptor protein [Mucilaginibacter lappiensis]SIR84932.1 iron complex outermembrane recepter protein [Mucilaginibacter lappiensis]